MVKILTTNIWQQTRDAYIDWAKLGYKSDLVNWDIVCTNTGDIDGRY